MASRERDNTEQPVREQLQKTTIAPASSQQQNSSAAPRSSSPDSAHPIAEPLRKKRSLDEIDPSLPLEHEAGKSSHAKHHTRKRSRDSTTDGEDLRTEYKRTSHEVQRDLGDDVTRSNGIKQDSLDRPATPQQQVAESAAVVDAASPKSKRSRLQDGVEGHAARSDAGSSDEVGHRSNGSSDSTEPALPAKTAQQTSSSAFAASGFSALASNKASGFGALGKTAGGFGGGKGFASPSSDPSNKTPPSNASLSKPGDQSTKAEQTKTTTAASTFGGALGARSAFSSAAGTAGSSAFGGGFGSSSGFGSLGGSTQLSAFTAKNGASTFTSTKPTRSFGAPVDENNDSGNEDDGGIDGDDGGGVKSPVSVGTEEDQKDSRFFEQKVETGEEEEEVIYQSRAKLYNYAVNTTGKKEWRERGIGTLRLNASRSTHGDQEVANEQSEENDNTSTTARLLIRADGSHRVLLNSPIVKGLKVGGVQGGPPTNGQLSFMGTIDGKTQLELLQLKVCALE